MFRKLTGTSVRAAHEAPPVTREGLMLMADDLADLMNWDTLPIAARERLVSYRTTLQDWARDAPSYRDTEHVLYLRKTLKSGARAVVATGDDHRVFIDGESIGSIDRVNGTWSVSLYCHRYPQRFTDADSARVHAFSLLT